MIIRKIEKNEIDLLRDFLYEAIFIPEGVDPPPRDINDQPELRLYYEGFGTGAELMKEMLELLKTQGYEKASLAVQKANYAVRMYEKVGFEVVDENDEEFIMVCNI